MRTFFLNVLVIVLDDRWKNVSLVFFTSKDFLQVPTFCTFSFLSAQYTYNGEIIFWCKGTVIRELNSPVTHGSKVQVLGASLKEVFSEAPTGGWDMDGSFIWLELNSSGS